MLKSALLVPWIFLIHRITCAFGVISQPMGHKDVYTNHNTDTKEMLYHLVQKMYRQGIVKH